jgi:hypothetical protein
MNKMQTEPMSGAEAAAEAFVATSPVRNAGLYAHHHLYDFADQIG